MKSFKLSNPTLHMLYVEYAVQDLAIIDNALKALNKACHTSLFGAICSLEKERNILIQENEAFKDANKLILLYKGKWKESAQPETQGE